ncbi:MAG: tRNA pseudouridine(38-40) synthase TruA [Turicibacter sp.]|nr:tRNA pseudouridine(38-40) synthase TruA [Turicibacter sp.]
MKRIKCTVAYDGTLFNGYQRQPGQRTVQGEIEAALEKICKVPITIHSSGRTDTGVHAHGQVFHFDSEVQMDGTRYSRALNSMLPKDIYVLESQEVHPEFHSRYHGKVKEYRYKLSLNMYNPLKRNYVYYHHRPLDTKRMCEAMQYLLGTHDFTSFCGNLDEINKERTIYQAELLEDEGELTFIFVGNGFLRYMIRIMVGTLIQVGEGRKQPEDIKRILELKDRRLAGHTAKPQGLYLQRVDYPKELLKPMKEFEE